MQQTPRRVRDFYADTIDDALQRGALRRTDRILVVAGGPYDRQVLLDAGFRDVTITNVHRHKDETVDYSPFIWERQDANALTYPDRSFDSVIVHAGLHHFYSPHRALAEMYRTARSTIIVMETRDSALMRFAAKFGLTEQYELSAVIDSGYRSGGVENQPIPNYVYRWTEREVEKVVRALDPTGEPRIVFRYGLLLPVVGSHPTMNVFRRRILQTLHWVAGAIELLVPRQCNQFGAIIQRPTETQSFPWIQFRDGHPLMRTDMPGVARRPSCTPAGPTESG